MTSSEQLECIFKRTKELLKKKEHIYNDLMKKVRNYGVQIVNFDKLSKEEKMEWRIILRIMLCRYYLHR